MSYGLERAADTEKTIKYDMLEENDVEVKSPVIRPCQLCKKNIPRETTAFLSQGKYYHKECFKCTICNQRCSSGNYLIRHDNKIVCRGCQETSEEQIKRERMALTAKDKCHGCKKDLIGAGQKFADKLYHRECFKCASCSKPFQVGKVVIQNGEPVHEECKGGGSGGSVTMVRKNITGPTVQLERLAEMHRAGILTDEEFAQEKKKVLGI